MTEAGGSVNPILVAGRCKGWVCGSLHPGTACSNPPKVLNVCLLVGHGMTEAQGSVNPILVAGRCKGWVCGSLHPGTACSNPPKVLNVCLLVLYTVSETGRSLV